jgi:hypothetical protein
VTKQLQLGNLDSLDCALNTVKNHVCVKVVQLKNGQNMAVIR